jgi:alkanesulfonate monooxygenase
MSAVAPDFLWFCQLSRDGEFVGTKALPPRKPTLPYLSSLIETAAEAGFSSLLTATNYHHENETWTAGVAALARTQGAGLLLAVRPGMYHPSQFAKMVSTAANMFPGRVRINVVTGSSPAENVMYGDFEAHAKRYERTREFMLLLRKLWSETPVSFEGSVYKIENAVLEPKPPETIPLYFGGASEPAQRIAAELADVYLMWGESQEMIAERMATMKALEAEYGRTLRYGLRTHVIVRETEAEAWAAAERMISRIDPEIRKAFVESYKHVDSVGQRRQIEMGLKGDLLVEPHLWAGVGLARSGVGVAIVGDPQQVADKLKGYQRMGIDTFILSSYPHLEEARRFGELVMPYFQEDKADARALHTDTVAPAF